MTSRKPKKAAPKKRKQTLTSVARRLDILARDICKLSSGFTCQRCGAKGDSSTIEWAHIEPRRKRAIRWSEMNCLALCNRQLNGCHPWFDGDRVTSMKWLKETFPEKHAWLAAEENGTSRSRMVITHTVQGRLDLEELLKARKAELEGK